MSHTPLSFIMDIKMDHFWIVQHANEIIDDAFYQSGLGGPLTSKVRRTRTTQLVL